MEKIAKPRGTMDVMAPDVFALFLHDRLAVADGPAVVAGELLDPAEQVPRAHARLGDRAAFFKNLHLYPP